MAWFRKKEDKKSSSGIDYDHNDIPQLEELPALPSLPELPSLQKTNFSKQEKLQPLPNFSPNYNSNSSILNKFPQNSIKNAVYENEFDVDGNIPYEFKAASIKLKKAEPIFVRLDKFESSLEEFESIKEKVEEIKSILKDIKEKKAQEEQELNKWESQLQEMKSQIEKIDQNIFSKIE